MPAVLRRRAVLEGSRRREASGPATLADSFPRIVRSLAEERAERRRELQRDVDPETLTPEELLGWKLAELKAAARALLRRDTGPG